MAFTGTIGSSPATRLDASCMFCGTPLLDEGGPFLEHIDRAPGCKVAYKAWVENLASDWHGGD